MRYVDTLIIGGGQAGLALSRSLTDRDVRHVVLERGRIGERWRSERWDSLRLLTPRWQSRLPGQEYQGADPDGFMTSGELVEYLESYAESFDAPVHAGVSVTGVSPYAGDFLVETMEGSWRARNVVIATGDCMHPYVPSCAQNLDATIDQVVPTKYKNPDQLADGGVLVVGASATGLQLAREIHESGRPVTLSVSRHTRLPRLYRGRDILAWLDEMGVLNERAEHVRDLASSRAQPSLQLAGTLERVTLDLSSLLEQGVQLTGRTSSIEGNTVAFADNLIEDVAAADLKLARLRLRIDQHIATSGLAGIVPPPPSMDMTEVDAGPDELDLGATGIRTVLWATGFRRSYPWLHVPVLDEQGEIEHEGGVAKYPGLYVMGLRFLRRRNSSFIDGQAKDAEELADHIASRHRAAVAAIA